jgi:hypothetical protein
MEMVLRTAAVGGVGVAIIVPFNAHLFLAHLSAAQGISFDTIGMPVKCQSASRVDRVVAPSGMRHLSDCLADAAQRGGIEGPESEPIFSQEGESTPEAMQRGANLAQALRTKGEDWQFQSNSLAVVISSLASVYAVASRFRYGHRPLAQRIEAFRRRHEELDAQRSRLLQLPIPAEVRNWLNEDGLYLIHKISAETSELARKAEGLPSETQVRNEEVPTLLKDAELLLSRLEESMNGAEVAALDARFSTLVHLLDQNSERPDKMIYEARGLVEGLTSFLAQLERRLYGTKSRRAAEGSLRMALKGIAPCSRRIESASRALGGTDLRDDFVESALLIRQLVQELGQQERWLDDKSGTTSPKWFASFGGSGPIAGRFWWPS